MSQVKLNEVKYIFCTHSHPDHTGAAASLKAITGASILAHEPCSDLKISVKDKADLNLISNDLIVDRILNDNESIPLGNDAIQIVYTPGHADDHICLFLQNSQILFTGDLVTHSDIGYLNLNYHFSQSLESISLSLNKCESLNPKYIFPGHGELLCSNSHLWKNLKRKIYLFHKNPSLLIPHTLISPILFFINTKVSVHYKFCQEYISSLYYVFDEFMDGITAELITEEYQKLIALLEFKKQIIRRNDFLSVPHSSGISQSLWLNDII